MKNITEIFTAKGKNRSNMQNISDANTGMGGNIHV